MNNSPYAIIEHHGVYYVVSEFKKTSVFSNLEFMGIVYNENGDAKHNSYEEAQKTINRLLEHYKACKEEENQRRALHRLVKTGKVVSTITF